MIKPIIIFDHVKTENFEVDLILFLFNGDSRDDRPE